MLKVKSNILNIKDSTTGRYEPLPGTTGESAYEVAKRNGYKGTEADWKKETSGTVEYVDTAGFSNRANAFMVDDTIGSDVQPVFFGVNGRPAPITLELGDSCALNATDDIEVEERCVITTLALNKALNGLYSKAIVPSVNGSLIYNGTVQTPTFVNFDERMVSVKGTVSATNAGRYTAIFTPKSPYSWTDGTTTPVSVVWTIDKADLEISTPSTRIRVPKGTDSVTIPINKNGDGAIEVKTTNTKINVSLVDGQLFVERNSTGSFGSAIDITVQEGTNYKKSNTLTIRVYCLGFDIVSWSSGSYEDIAEMIDHHNKYGTGYINVRDYWSIGDTRKVHLSAIPYSNAVGCAQPEQDIELVIIGFNHDRGDGGLGAITVQVKDVLMNKGYVKSNSSRVNYGLWQSDYGSDLRDWCNNDFKNALPEELTALIKSTDKYTNNGGYTGYYSAAQNFRTQDRSKDYIFFLSNWEVFGDNNMPDSYSYSSVFGSRPNDGNQYEYYQTSSQRVKNIKIDTQAGETSQKTGWWLRNSFIYDSSRNMCMICDENGKPGSYWYNYKFGIAPAFRL